MSELRHDPIQRRWVIISTERGLRPMDLQPVAQPVAQPQSTCPFCRGQERHTPPEIARVGDGNGSWDARVVPNKFPALGIEGDIDRRAVGQFDRMNGIGAHEVVIETPDHATDLAETPLGRFAAVLRLYRDRLADLMRDPRLRFVIVFKNHGDAAGASLSHPHSQIIATPVTPLAVAAELQAAREHYNVKERCLFCDIMHQELAEQRRVVVADADFVTIAPYASRNPFEMMLMPRRHAHDFSRCDDAMLLALACHFREVLRRMKAALGDVPYNFILHTAPNSIHSVDVRGDYWKTLHLDWHWHFEILPRLTRVAGFEWGTGFYINPTAPEDAARYLREVDPS